MPQEVFVDLLDRMVPKWDDARRSSLGHEEEEEEEEA